MAGCGDDTALRAGRDAPSRRADPGPSPGEDNPKAQAEKRFKQAVKLYAEGAYEAALAEFLALRALHPTRIAGENG